MNNTIKTILLFGIFGVLLISLGNYFGGRQGLYLMTGISIVINLVMYFFSDKIALMSAKAKPITKNSPYSFIKDEVKDLTQKAGLPMPKVYISEQEQPNAFATGRNPKHSAVVVTKGLSNILDRNEIRGVLAHELSHIKNRDILISTIAAVLGSIITSLAHTLRWMSFFGSSDEGRNPLADLLVMILAPIAAIIIQMAISRSREYVADKSAAELLGTGNGLAAALNKLEQVSKSGILQKAGKVNPAFENLYIVNPLSGREMFGAVQKLFSTHPPIAERVGRLRNM
ncbi:MAG: M48 family metalloprotease [Candidatus Moranbacteria bacterium]|nr:M48 family metalloprotease [Candidatus Moranbacteria bacterium]